jgi:hypothetical protein
MKIKKNSGQLLATCNEPKNDSGPTKKFQTGESAALEL